MMKLVLPLIYLIILSIVSAPGTAMVLNSSELMGISSDHASHDEKSASNHKHDNHNHTHKHASGASHSHEHSHHSIEIQLGFISQGLKDFSLNTNDFKSSFAQKFMPSDFIFGIFRPPIS